MTRLHERRVTKLQAVNMKKMSQQLRWKAEITARAPPKGLISQHFVTCTQKGHLEHHQNVIICFSH